MSVHLIYDENSGRFRPTTHLNGLLPIVTGIPAGKPLYCRNWQTANRKDHGSILKHNEDEFHVNLDVQHFKPDEVVVKTNGRTIIVEGHHPERLDEHGFVSRKFTRKYVLPKCYNNNEVKSSLSSDGILTIVAPKIVENEAGKVKEIAVVQTGIPHHNKKPIENK